MRRTHVLPLLALLALAPSRAARAHALAPSLLALEEKAPGEVEALWRTPLQGPLLRSLRPVFPAGCSVVGVPEHALDATRQSERVRLRCTAASLVGTRLRVEGLEAAGTNVLLRIGLADGRRLQALLSARAPAYDVPARQSKRDVAASFLALGFEHLATGVDHLLFVAGLVCLLRGSGRLLAARGSGRLLAARDSGRLLAARGSGRLLGAVSAFTAGHSVTLALATLGVVRLPSAIVEVGIAASLVLLAHEIVRERAGHPPGALARRPWAMAFGFGLLHGLGFAGALTAAGLPGDEVPLALASFNAGIEAAQLVLVAILLAGARAMRPLPAVWRALAPRIAAEAIGLLGVFFCLERVAVVLGR
jgi:hypothetical protein